MKFFDSTYRIRRQAATAAVLVVLILAATAPAATIKFKDGRTVDGADLRVNAKGDFVITVGASQRTYPAAQVEEAVADRPAAYDRATQLFQAGQYDEALKLLEQVAADYYKLGWDDRANYAAARIHVNRGAYEEAKKAFGKLPRSFRQQPDVRVSLAQAQLETGAYAEAELALDELIRSAPREVAARAQSLRGDLKMKRRQLEPAVEDYLRTVVLFEDVRSVQPEALYKVGKALEEQRDARAKDMFAKLKREYPDSEYAAKARQE